MNPILIYQLIWYALIPSAASTPIGDLHELNYNSRKGYYDEFRVTPSKKVILGKDSRYSRVLLVSHDLKPMRNMDESAPKDEYFIIASYPWKEKVCEYKPFFNGGEPTPELYNKHVPLEDQSCFSYEDFEDIFQYVLIRGVRNWSPEKAFEFMCGPN